MKRRLYYIAVTGLFGSALAMMYACGGGGSGGGSSSGTGTTALPYTGKKTQADVTAATAAVVAASLVGPGGFVPICTASAPSGKVIPTNNQETVSAVKALNLVTMTASKSLALIGVSTSTPADKPGTCGGFLRYKNWSHSSGSTSGTLSYENYCYQVLTTSDQVTINGDIPFSAPGAPGDTGPKVSKITASTPIKITLSTSAVSKVVALTTPLLNAEIAFEGLEITPGTIVSGFGTTLTNDTNPDTYKVGKVVIKDVATGKHVLAENITLTMVKTPDGGTKETISGRLYDSDSGYMDVTTDPANPILVNSSGIHTSGILTVSGSNPANKATLTIVPATAHSPAFTVKVNNIPVGGAINCYNPWTRKN